MAEHNQTKWRGIRNIPGDPGIEIRQDTAADFNATVFLGTTDRQLLTNIKANTRSLNGDTGTQIHQEATQSGAGTAIVHTVTAGKTFYLTLTHFEGEASAANKLVTLSIRNDSDVTQFTLSSHTLSTLNETLSENFAFTPPMKIAAGWDIVVTAVANSVSRAFVHGWEE